MRKTGNVLSLFAEFFKKRIPGYVIICMFSISLCLCGAGISPVLSVSADGISGNSVSGNDVDDEEDEDDEEDVDGEDDGDDEDGEAGEDSEDDGDDEDDGEEDPLPDNPEPYETLDVRGYNYGYTEGKKDGTHDAEIDESSSGQRAYQINDPSSLYSRIQDPASVTTENKSIGYPVSLLPVSADRIDAYRSYAGKWQEGYRDGYSYSVGEGAEEIWYEKGHAFGYLDAQNDVYDPDKEHGEDDRMVGNGYYEPDFSDSLYNSLGGKFGDAYRAGYDAGWKDGISSFSYSINYGSQEFDPWRISTCPLNWDKADSLFFETGRDISNVYFDTEYMAFMDYNGEQAAGKTAAFSPYAWFFSEDYSYIFNGEVKSKKTDVLKKGVNTAISSEENWLYRTVDAGNNLYILVRYKVGNMAEYKNLKVRRYVYSKEKENSGAVVRSVVTDHINDYYNGNEPVVSYDSRKIVDAERKEVQGEEISSRNTRKKRKEIRADAVLVSWEAGKNAEYLGKITVRAKASNNVNASVSGNYMEYLGDARINFTEMTGNNRFYHVSKKEALDDSGNRKNSFTSVTFAGTRSIGKLNREDNAALNGEGPGFTLKIKNVGKEIFKYKKQIKKALKNEKFLFEIARFNISGKNYEEEEPQFSACTKFFSYDSEIARHVAKIKPAPLRRRDYEDYESYSRAVKKYNEGMKALKDYYDSDEYKKGFLKELQEARKAYMEEYRALITEYGSNSDKYAAYLEKYVFPEYIRYSYKKKYSDAYFKDGNKDGTVTETEQWEYDNLYGPEVLNDLDHYNFNGKIDRGENVIPDKNAYNADYETVPPDIESVPWIKGSYYSAETLIYLDPSAAAIFKGNVNEAADYSVPELNDELYTQNYDVKISLGKLRTVTKKKEARLMIAPTFDFYTGETADGDRILKGRRRLKTKGKRTDLSLSGKTVGDKAVLLIHGENNLEGDLAIRMRSSGEAGYGIWIDDSNNYIDSLP